MARGGVRLNAKVRISKEDFGGFERRMEKAIERGMKRTAEEAIVAAKAVNKRGYRIDHIIGNVKIGGIQRYNRGLELLIRWSDWRVHFFNTGTYQRKGALKKGGDPPGPNRGIRPIRFMTVARRVARKRLLENIKRYAPR